MKHAIFAFLLLATVVGAQTPAKPKPLLVCGDGSTCRTDVEPGRCVCTPTSASVKVCGIDVDCGNGFYPACNADSSNTPCKNSEGVESLSADNPQPVFQTLSQPKFVSALWAKEEPYCPDGMGYHIEWIVVPRSLLFTSITPLESEYSFAAMCVLGAPQVVFTRETCSIEEADLKNEIELLLGDIEQLQKQLDEKTRTLEKSLSFQSYPEKDRP